MLILNGKTLARDAQEALGLLECGTPCAGFYKPTKAGIDILTPNNERVGVINSYGVMGRATRLPDGRWWYSYGDVPNIGPYESYLRQVDECEAAIRQHCAPGTFKRDNRPARF